RLGVRFTLHQDWAGSLISLWVWAAAGAAGTRTRPTAQTGACRHAVIEWGRRSWVHRRPPTRGPPVAARRYFFFSSFDPGGKSLKSLSEALASFFWFFSGLSDSSSVAMPRHRSCLVLASKMSVTRVPTVYSLTVVVELPIPAAP